MVKSYFVLRMILRMRFLLLSFILSKNSFDDEDFPFES